MAEEDAIVYKRKAMSEKLKTYRDCLSGQMKGRRFETKEGRFFAFCTAAKLCSKKAKDKKEAEEQCLKLHPEWKVEEE